MKNMIKCRAETTVNLNTQARMNLGNKLSVEDFPDRKMYHSEWNSRAYHIPTN